MPTARTRGFSIITPSARSCDAATPPEAGGLGRVLVVHAALRSPLLLCGSKHGRIVGWRCTRVAECALLRFHPKPLPE
jgi:hypothetical protein